MTEDRKPGGRIFYGWIIIATTIAIVATATIIRPAFTLFYVAMLDEFGWSRAGTAIIISVSGMVYGISAPISGILFDRLGPRKIFPLAAILIAIGAFGCSRSNEIWQFSLFYGIIASLGLTLIGFTPVVVLATNWFLKRRALAVGLCTTGIQGAMLMSPLVQFLISTLGWRNTYLAIGAIVPIVTIPLALLLRTRPQDMQLNPDGSTESYQEVPAGPTGEDSLIVDREWATTDWTLPKALKTYRFWALFSIMFCLATSFTILFTHQVAHMVDIGFTPAFGASMLVVFAIAAMCGRLGGFVSDKIGREITYTMGTIGVITGILMLTLAKGTSDAWMVYLFAIFYGLFAGSNAPTYAATAADLFHGKHFGSILGSADLGFGIGATLGPWFGGFIFDVTGSYLPAFTTAMVALVIACISIWVASPGKVRLVAGKAPARAGPY